MAENERKKMSEQKHKAGFVNIVGNPNVGKSTIMNALVGERISIITSKSQTTRHRILGIVNGEDFQIVYSDTPGVIKPNYKLQESMLKYSRSALVDADVILYVTDVKEDPDKNQEFLDSVRNTNTPVILIINKIDLSNQEKVEQLVIAWQERFPKAEIYPTAALHNFNLENLLERIKALIPENPPYFDKNALTDKPERFFVTEIIRGKILENYRKEIPYSVEPEVEEFKEDEKIIRIMVKIHVERESQKGIIIGHKGSSLKKVGIESRKELEVFFDKQVHLQMFVTVSKDWRNKDLKLKSFGYDQ